MQEKLPKAPAGLSPWWQPLTLKPGEIKQCQVGPLSLYLERGEGCWLVGSEELEDVPENHRVALETRAELPDAVSFTRYVFAKSPATVCLKPRLLDRPVVVKTDQPVKIPAGEQVTFYISSPVNVSVELQNPALVLLEVPSLRLSDTWFGPSTCEGEVCYAARTLARINRSTVPLRPHRAVTPVMIHNRSQEQLTIDKLSIPVPFLAVYGLDDGTLWTDGVSLEHTQGNSLANLTIDQKLPFGINEKHRLSGSRLPIQKGSLVRAFTNMLIG